MLSLLRSDLTSLLTKDKNAEGEAARSPSEATAKESTKAHAEDIHQKKLRIGKIMKVVRKSPPSVAKKGALVAEKDAKVASIAAAGQEAEDSEGPFGTIMAAIEREIAV